MGAPYLEKLTTSCVLGGIPLRHDGKEMGEASIYIVMYIIHLQMGASLEKTSFAAYMHTFTRQNGDLVQP